MSARKTRPPLVNTIHRAFKIAPEVDRALGFVSIQTDRDKSALVEEALRLYLPTVSDLEPVKAIAIAS